MLAVDAYTFSCVNCWSSSRLKVCRLCVGSSITLLACFVFAGMIRPPFLQRREFWCEPCVRHTDRGSAPTASKVDSRASCPLRVRRCNIRSGTDPVRLFLRHLGVQMRHPCRRHGVLPVFRTTGYGTYAKGCPSGASDAVEHHRGALAAGR